jgi:hypothetical protein
MTALAQACVGAHEWNRSNSGGEPGQSSTTTYVRRRDLVFVTEEAKLKTLVRATADAVHAHEAFGFTPGHSADGVIATLAIEQATIALIAT